MAPISRKSAGTDFGGRSPDSRPEPKQPAKHGLSSSYSQSQPQSLSPPWSWSQPNNSAPAAARKLNKHLPAVTAAELIG